MVMLPMYLFATTFYPLWTYPAVVRPLVEILPLYPAIQLVREPALGHLGPWLFVPVGYLLVFGIVAMRISTRRMARIMLH